MPKQYKLPLNGPTRTVALDGARLNSQLATVLRVMSDGHWRTFGQIAILGKIRMTAAASISARLRDLRRLGYSVDRRRVGNPSDGLHEYRLSGQPKQEAA